MTDMDRQAVERVREFSGRIEEMPDDERIYLLGYLAEAVARLLGEDAEDLAAASSARASIAAGEPVTPWAMPHPDTNEPGRP